MQTRVIDHICCNLAEVPVAEGTGNFVEIFNTNQDRRGLQVSPQGDLTILEARGDHAGQYKELLISLLSPLPPYVRT